MNIFKTKEGLIIPWRIIAFTVVLLLLILSGIYIFNSDATIAEVIDSIIGEVFASAIFLIGYTFFLNVERRYKQDEIMHKFLSAISNKKIYKGYVALADEANPFIRENHTLSLLLHLNTNKKIKKLTEKISYSVLPLSDKNKYPIKLSWSPESHEKLISISVTHNNKSILFKEGFNYGDTFSSQSVEINLLNGNNKIEIEMCIEYRTHQDEISSSINSRDYIEGKTIIIQSDDGDIDDLYQCNISSYSPCKIEDYPVGSNPKKKVWSTDAAFLPYQGTSIEISKK